ncbi:hypothetical protein GA0115241_106027, partial [Streptomyces sp. DpondAA-D4]
GAPAAGRRPRAGLSRAGLSWMGLSRMGLSRMAGVGPGCPGIRAPGVLFL